MKRLVAAASVLLGASFSASGAHADKLAAAVPDADDVRKTVLVGPSGELYEPDGAGAWARHQEGGVAADVIGAGRVDGDVVVAGHATPMYRDHGGEWFTLEVGEDGKTQFSRGPTAAVAVDKAVLVLQKKKGKSTWSRVASLPAKATGVWADGTNVWASTDSALYHLRGSSFAKAGAAPRGFATGAAWAITDTGLLDLGSDKTCPATLDGNAVTIAAAGGAKDASQLTVVADTGDTGAGLVLARTAKDRKGLEKIDALPIRGTVAVVAVDSAGGVLVALTDGSVALYISGKWQTGSVTDDLPKSHSGSPPAHAG